VIEERRRDNAKTRVLDKLRTHSRVTNLDLNKISHRYSARIHELRQEGHVVQTLPLGKGVVAYIYKGFEAPLFEQTTLFSNRPYDD